MRFLGLFPICATGFHFEPELADKIDGTEAGVRPPAAWLRVSDHMDAIVAFIERLVEGVRSHEPVLLTGSCKLQPEA